ncbi:DUF1735 and LamG domain-containing protein [Prevotella sp. A2931]|uniref:DUF1735 and LamG domain-containing protein n=1 Tax=Prevotella illustrans TaxID=2800387 RepID=A0ABS3M7R1_9BACT|nr:MULTISPECIES: DUF1735 and LamG domain-containing protein [Prevotella]MBO1364184.1 DUF1735 and LamG domain-containing protein [Prevotella illustrans]PTL26178.1 hypothetical protein C3V39_03365 [Prevotella sp. oral taxon 820]
MRQFFYHKTILALCALGLMTATSCEDAKYTVLEDQAFIDQTKTNGNTTRKVVVEDEGETETSFKVLLSKPTDEDCSFGLVIDQEALDRYNKDNFTNYKVMAQAGYSLSTQEIKIAKGESQSALVNIKVKPFTEEQKKAAEKFALPLKLVSKDGKKEVLVSGGSIVYLFDNVVRQAVPTYNKTNVIKFELKDDLELTEWSVEYCVNIDNLGTHLGEKNNQQLFCGWGKDGGEIFSRFGDAPIEGNRMNIKTQGQQLNSNMKFSTNTWYHIAIVCSGTSLKLYVNGLLDNSVPLPGKVTKINKNNVWFGNSTERDKWLKANVMVSECRLWTRALSQSQIVNNMYAADQGSAGLYAYFKFNEGSGDSFEDARKNGNTAHVDGAGNITWTPNVRIDGK